MHCIRWLFAIVVLLGTSVPASALNPGVPCAKSDQEQAEGARATAAQGLELALDKLRKDDEETRQLLTRWFGNADAATRRRVQEVLGRSRSWLLSVGFKCHYANQGQSLAFDRTGLLIDRSGKLFAWVPYGDQSTIHLGLLFWQAPDTGPDSKFGTIIHEMTHFWMSGKVADQYEPDGRNHYGRERTLELARSAPKRALDHADAYQYFVEDLSGP